MRRVYRDGYVAPSYDEISKPDELRQLPTEGTHRRALRESDLCDLTEGRRLAGVGVAAAQPTRVRPSSRMVKTRLLKKHSEASTARFLDDLHHLVGEGREELLELLLLYRLGSTEVVHRLRRRGVDIVETKEGKFIAQLTETHKRHPELWVQEEEVLRKNRYALLPPLKSHLVPPSRECLPDAVLAEERYTHDGQVDIVLALECLESSECSLHTVERIERQSLLAEDDVARNLLEVVDGLLRQRLVQLPVLALLF